MNRKTDKQGKKTKKKTVKKKFSKTTASKDNSSNAWVKEAKRREAKDPGSIIKRSAAKYSLQICFEILEDAKGANHISPDWRLVKEEREYYEHILVLKDFVRATLTKDTKGAKATFAVIGFTVTTAGGRNFGLELLEALSKLPETDLKRKFNSKNLLSTFFNELLYPGEDVEDDDEAV